MRKKKFLEDKLSRVGFFFGAVLFHLVLFLVVCTVVIWKAPAPPQNNDFQRVASKVTPPPAPVEPPASGAQADNPMLEPQPVTVPVVTPLSAITSFHNDSFTVDNTKVLNQALSHMSTLPAEGAGLSTGGGNADAGTGTGFGSTNGSGDQLTGYFYDFKQDRDRKPTKMTVKRFLGVLEDYLTHGWDESKFDPYYKSKLPIYTNNFAITTRHSEEAPTAFGLQNEVQPAMWAIHYQAKVVAPSSGEYRFTGFGDDCLAIRIDGHAVLDGGWVLLTGQKNLRELLPFTWSPIYKEDGRLRRGTSFHADAGRPMDMDVLIGDQGGFCAFYLLVEKLGNIYETLPDGTPKLPFFQINGTAAPVFPDGEEHPPYSTTTEPWQSAKS